MVNFLYLNKILFILFVVSSFKVKSVDFGDHVLDGILFETYSYCGIDNIVNNSTVIEIISNPLPRMSVYNDGKVQFMINLKNTSRTSSSEVRIMFEFYSGKDRSKKNFVCKNICRWNYLPNSRSLKDCSFELSVKESIKVKSCFVIISSNEYGSVSCCKSISDCCKDNFC